MAQLVVHYKSMYGVSYVTFSDQHIFSNPYDTERKLCMTYNTHQVSQVYSELFSLH